MGVMAKCFAQGARMIGAQCCIALLSRFLHGYGGGLCPQLVGLETIQLLLAGEGGSLILGALVKGWWHGR